MIIQENDFLLSEDEIFDLAQHLQPERSRLVILPNQAPITPSGIMQDYEQLSEEKRDYLNAIVRGLAYPVRLMRLHYSIADESVSRQLIVWRGESDEVITLARNGKVWRASTNSEFGVHTLIKEMLGAGSDLRRDPFALSLSSSSVLVFLGILEQMRYARLYSTLMSQTPVEVFAPVDVMERMHQAVKEDFRWPLAMFEKVLPVRMMDKVQLEDVTEGLNELVKLQLVEACDEKGLLYQLTPPGFMVADGVLHEVSKAALCITQCRADGVVGHDAVLLVRSSFYLFLFELSGEVGALATLDEEGADLFLAKTMETPDAETVSAATPLPGQNPDISPAPPVEPASQPVEVAPYTTLQSPMPPSSTNIQPLICTHCGKTLKTGAQYCPDCGQAVFTSPPMVTNVEPAITPQVSVCPSCGNPVKPSAKFCRNCGAAL
jgi:predicted RNA-binding Zn-ribbon protein involved in translation (DUF1610 family)